LALQLRVALYRNFELRILEATEELLLAPHSTIVRPAEEVLGRFVDISYAYRFGPPQHDLVVTSLTDADGATVAQDFRFPLGRPEGMRGRSDLGIAASAVRGPSGELSVTLQAKQLLYGARVSAPGYVPSDDAFNTEPGRPTTVRLDPATSDGHRAEICVSALNLANAVMVRA
jgi:beta-mannosidase